MIIELGLEGWTFPIPLVKNNESWYFDTLAGVEIVKTRSIGKNELSTMQAALAYYDAQNEYSEQDRNDDGVLEYAQKFISNQGERMKFGFALLAWPAEYGDTGVMSFLINHDGVFYEKDLGLDTDKMIDQINSFEPGEGWGRVEETTSL